MLKFGLACEGVTDQAVIENILCGFYNDKELRQEIKSFQPLFDATQKKQLDGEFGGWEELFSFIATKRFRQDVINNHYMIIQVDTDCTEHKNFGISQHNCSIKELVERVRERLILQINSKKPFYEVYKHKIIFAISVHSLECWLLPICKDLKAEKITGCFESLQRECKDIKVEKNYTTYDKLSRVFLKNKELLKISSKNSSFDIFIKSLPKI